MTKKDYRRLIEFRVNEINKLTASNYVTEYNYGGWQMYEIDARHCPKNSTFGFSFERKTHSEMLNYVDAIWHTLCAVQNGQITITK